MSHIPILFEDGEALVINKPSGLPIERPRRGGASLEDHFEELKLGFQRAPMPVHRIDTDTSGCLLLARNAKALKRFAKAFEERLVEKRYLGVLSGVPADSEGTIELSLSKISSAEKGWRMIAAKKGKPSITHWRVLAEHGGHTLVEFRPETGRTHQIRVHCQAGLNLPLLGDPVYGNGKGAPRTMLHAAALTVPRTGKPPIDAAAPLPRDFAALGFADG
ncbi:MAG TPA: RNA pseudouridine synthase [Erythrobacter sp.]|jgi:tRNA pseudouridine32 synthase/23S rRNA pseudouridine746 synthase|uniref:RNA pseudouridine synthase n=1 Tax=Qipengyuania citrea TaxID=225971 RepID=A0A6I4UAB7_9SPHN|nr:MULTISPECIES: RNA pseudouridine synthase [Erythrobacteraceae]MAG05559.1 RNA pseudouridine synthase [Sphingomonadaceae bacterium]MBN91075.1 RNA pseudouridine synthase [Erythrobacteraceae bacterium]MCZ4263959.1 RNA pseudouridine synthase [Erythrobacter sp. G21629-S1]HAL89164.1 RNA pseudouridine synthase [Erythrobacter sp.]KZX93325.1 RNA pseudouridine synthase [Erythrobacter sp. HI0019]|tara:strand:+ start:4521 stop:5177 length:657 start_codon:yes stop_codon:yes gene_type:complete